MAGQNDLNPEFILIAGSIGMLILTTGIVNFIYLYQRKLIKRKLAFQEIEDLLKKQELESAYALLKGQDIERQRIAEELHDNLGSLLAALNMYADTALISNDKRKKNELISHIKDLGIKAGEEARSFAHRLDSAALKHFGLKAALHDLVQAITDNKPVKVKSEIKFHDEFKNEIALNLYRIIQELFNNTLKHAQADIISISLSVVNKEYISLIYEDNGIGFKESMVTTGIGLINIKARVQKLSGKVKIKSKKPGVVISIKIPLL